MEYTIANATQNGATLLCPGFNCGFTIPTCCTSMPDSKMPDIGMSGYEWSVRLVETSGDQTE